MSLPIYNLDDRSFDDLMKEALSLIPRYNRDWSNYNPSDPGITLLELFAWLSELVIYRTNQVPEKNYHKFLELIGITLEHGESLQSGIYRAIDYISSRKRAVTTNDYELLAMEAMESLEPGLAGRAICMNNRNFDLTTLDQEMPGHVSVFIIPKCNGNPEDVKPTEESEEINKYCKGNIPTGALITEVRSYLNTRRLLTTRIHVNIPNYKQIKIEASLVIEEGAVWDTVRDDAGKRLEGFFDPLTGGPDGKGWPMGRYLYRSEIYQILEGTAGVDHVFEVKLDRDAEQRHVALEEYQLIKLDLNTVQDIKQVESL